MVSLSTSPRRKTRKHSSLVSTRIVDHSKKFPKKFTVDQLRAECRMLCFCRLRLKNCPQNWTALRVRFFVQFPWGSLLRGVAGGDELVMRNLRCICSLNARLHVTLGLDPEKDRCEWERLELPEISIDYIEKVLTPRYLEAGLRIVRTEAVSAAELARFHTSWAKRVQQSDSRLFFSLVAIAEE